MKDFHEFIEKNKDRIICYPSEKTYQELLEDKEKILLSSVEQIPVNEETTEELTTEEIEKKVDELISIMRSDEDK